MKVRLIKKEVSPPRRLKKQPPPQVPIIETVRSWVLDFRTSTANDARVRFQRLKNLQKT